jgi:hypothetical protein
MKDSIFPKVISKALGVALPMLEIIKTGSSMIPVPMVQPLIGVVAGFLQAADVSCTLILFCGVLMGLFSKPVITLNGSGGSLPPLRSV